MRWACRANPRTARAFTGPARRSDGIVVNTTYGAGLSSTTARGIPLYLNIVDEGDTLIDAQLNGSDEMVVDNFGNLYLAGTLTQNDASRYATRRAAPLARRP